MTSFSRPWFAAALLLALGSCARTDVFQNIPPTVAVTPATATVALGRSQRFTATTVPEGLAVTWTLSDTAQGGRIDADGVYTAPASFPAGIVKLTLQAKATLVEQPDISAEAAITVVPPTAGPVAKLVAVSGAGQQVAAGATLPEPLVVEAEDAEGNGVAGVNVDFAPAASPTATTTDASGFARAQPAAPTTAGPATFTASSDGLAPVTFAVDVVAGPLATLTASHPHPDGHVGATLADPLVLSFADQYGNPISGAAAIATPPEGASAAPLAETSGADGTVDYTITLGTASGTETFTFTSASDPTISTTFDFDAHGGPATSLAILSGDGQTATVGAGVAEPLVVKLEDAGGFPANPTALSWTTPDGGQLGNAQTTSGADGTASATLTMPTTAGLVRVVCEAPGVAGSPVTFVLRALPGPAQRLQLVSGDGQSTTSLNRFGGAFSVRATDAFSNGVAGAPVHFEVVTGGGSISPQDAVTGDDGLAQALMTAGLAGQQQYRASSPGLVGSPITISGTVTAPGLPVLSVVSGGGQTGLTGATLPALLIVKVASPLGQPMSGQTIRWAVAAGDGGLVPATSTTASDGTASTTARLGSEVGQQRFSATLPGALGSPVFFDETASARPVALLRAVSGAGQVSTPGSALPAPLVVQAFDDTGSPVTGATIVFAAPAGAGVTPATATTDANGEAQATARLAAASGDQTFTATAQGTSASASFLETASQAAATLHVAITGGQGQSAEVGSTLPQPLEVTVTDDLGAPASNVTVTFSAPTSGASVSAPTATTDGSGKASTIATLGQTLGAELFLATVDGAQGSPATFTETATTAPPDHLEIVSGDGQSALSGTALAHPFVVRAVDRAGNPKSGVGLTFRVGLGGGSITPATATTGDDGTAQANATLGAAAGPQTFFVDATGVPSIVFTATATAAIDHLSVSPQGRSVDVQASVRYTATAVYADGTTSDVTSDATWSSTSAQVATVSDQAGSKGAALAVGAGTTTIRATLNGKTGETSLTVNAATLASVVVLPAAPTLAVGSTRPFSATGNYSDGSVSDVTGTATWTSSDPTIATVSDAAGSKGQVIAKGVGTATITATVNGLAGTRVVTVTPSPLARLEVTPANVVEPAGTAFDFRATATYADGTVEDVTRSATWSSSDTAKLTVQNAPAAAGRATLLAQGSADVQASWQGASAKQTVTITEATVVSLAIVPQRVDLAVFDFFQLGLVATYSDGTVQNAADLATWSSSAPNVADVSNAAGQRGVVTGIASGTATVTAKLGGASATVDVHVSSATVFVIRILTAPLDLGGGGPGGPGGGGLPGGHHDASCPVGSTVRLYAAALYTNVNPADISDQASWTSSSPSVAVVGNGPQTGGLVQCLAQGTTTIEAEYEGKSDSIQLTVTAAALTTIELAPGSATLAQGDMTRFFATGDYSDGSRLDLTGLVTWSTGDASVLSASNAAGNRGEATALVPGQTTMIATYDGVTGSAPVTVTDAQLQFVVVTPANPVVNERQRQVQFSATAVYSDGTTNDVTAQAAWGTTDPSVAVISNNPQQIGWALLQGSGSCQVDASYRGKSGTTTLTVR